LLIFHEHGFIYKIFSINLFFIVEEVYLFGIKYKQTKRKADIRPAKKNTEEGDTRG